MRPDLPYHDSLGPLLQELGGDDRSTLEDLDRLFVERAISIGDAPEGALEHLVAAYSTVADRRARVAWIRAAKRQAFLKSVRSAFPRAAVVLAVALGVALVTGLAILAAHARPASSEAARSSGVSASLAGSSTATQTGASGLPDYTGHDASSSVADLRASGFIPVTRDQPSTYYSQGVVVSQTPSPGAQLKADGTVTLLVSSGPPASVQVPDLAGMSESAAAAELSSVGLVVGTVAKRYDVAPGGAVVESSPTAGSSADAGGRVDLTVSSGLQQVAATKPVVAKVVAKAAVTPGAGGSLSAAFEVVPASFDSRSQMYDNTLGAHILCTSKATGARRGLKIAWHAESSRYDSPRYDGVGSTFGFVIPSYRPYAIYTITMTATDPSRQTAEAMVSIDVDWTGKSIEVSH
jgi:hypothetical protein